MFKPMWDKFKIYIRNFLKGNQNIQSAEKIYESLNKILKQKKRFSETWNIFYESYDVRLFSEKKSKSNKLEIRKWVVNYTSASFKNIVFR